MAGRERGGQAPLMDRIYGPQKRIYDATRRLFLPGRDELLRGVSSLPPTGRALRVLEVGCGTGRNLFWLSRRCPEARLCGIDISRQMLDYAAARRSRLLARSRAHPSTGEISLVAGAAAEMDRMPEVLARAPFDAVIFSYSLSMMPDGREALQAALGLLAEGGSLHLVDFGRLEGWPAPFRRPVLWWLARWHVRGVPEAAEWIRRAAGTRGSQVSLRRIAGGYAFLLRMSGRAEAPRVISAAPPLR